jgi:single-stranded DNA-binding protein
VQGIVAAFVGIVGRKARLGYSRTGMPYVVFHATIHEAPSAKVQAPTWVKVVLCGARAEQLAPQLRGGTRVFCSGRLELWRRCEAGSWRCGLALGARSVRVMAVGALPKSGRSVDDA